MSESATYFGLPVIGWVGQDVYAKWAMDELEPEQHEAEVEAE